MARLFLSGDEVRITKADFNFVDVELYDGTHWSGLEPRRLFPRSGLTKYVSLIDKEGHEMAIIRDVECLIPESREVVEKSLDEFYLVPHVTAINDRKLKYGVLKLDVDTDRGRRVISIGNIYRDIKVLFDDRVLLRDTDDNRYEIPDLKKLDKKSLSLLSMDI